MKHSVFAADSILFRVTGPGAQRFLNRAARLGIRLSRLRCVPGGFTARAAGADCARLRALAGQDGCRWELLRRRRPGALLELLLARPGLPLGMALFLAAVPLLGCFVWTIDFGAMGGETQADMRELLAGCQIWEGAFLDGERLAAAQEQALRRSETFGWVSLNFAAGRLAIESTEAEYQTVQPAPGQTALVAAADGVIAAVEAESGFALVTVGQTVQKGEVLVDCVRLDRNGEPVVQGASGRVLASVVQTYTAFQPYEAETTALTGRRTEWRTVYFPGGSSGGAVQAEEADTEWLPLTLGRLSLPVCVRLQTLWERQPLALAYSEQTARAMALRDCARQLYEAFPDAVIAQERRSCQAEEDGVYCTVQYRFRADIASAAPAAE